jgi:hypothetical protein
MKLQNLDWTPIHYHEEHDTDGSLINAEWTEEAKYRKGYLIRDVHQDENGKLSISIAYAKTEE